MSYLQTESEPGGQENMTTTEMQHHSGLECPGIDVLKQLTGKWKPQILRLAMSGPVRFNTLLRVLSDANKQSISVALRELEEAGILSRQVINDRPLHVEYSMTEKGRSILSIYKLAASFTK